MASIFDDPNLADEVRKIFSRYSPKQSPLGQSFMTGSWFNDAPSLTMGEGGLLPANQRRALEEAQQLQTQLNAKSKKEAEEMEREQKKIRALQAKHKEIQGMPFDSFDEAMSYLRYLKSGEGRGSGAPELFKPALPESRKTYPRYKQTKGFFGGTEMTPNYGPFQPPAIPKIEAHQMRQPGAALETRVVGGKTYVKNELGQWVLAR